MEEPLSSGVLKSSEEIWICVFTEFDHFEIQTVKRVADAICSSRNLKFSANDFEERMTWML
jgi:hypothetical protein